MKPQEIRFENEFEQELPAKSIEEFNTLQSFSVQPTSLLETTLTDTLGLSMHNAVTNQQQSHMTTAASITNACARLLQTKSSPSSSKEVEAAALVAQQQTQSELQMQKVTEDVEVVQENKKKLSVLGFLDSKKGTQDEQE